MTRDDFIALIAEANLAPSVHNTQPTRWHIEDDHTVLVLEDSARRLAVGDPAGRDAVVSHGAAIEGFALASSAKDLAVAVSDIGASAVARLTISAGGIADPLHAFVPLRRTYRGAFVSAVAPEKLAPLAQGGDAVVVQSKDGIARLAALNDEASLKTFRDGAFRAELLSWMRLSRRDPRWSLDGLNAEAMEMSGLEAAGAGVVLKRGVFEALDRLKVARLFVAEAPVVRSAQAIVLFHRPEGEPPLETGRRFYRLWLEFTRAGVSAAPMAVLADDVEMRETIAREFGVPTGRRLITAFRLGVAPQRTLPPKPRLDVTSLIV
jgi:hypothetical protein